MGIEQVHWARCVIILRFPSLDSSQKKSFYSQSTISVNSRPHKLDYQSKNIAKKLSVLITFLSQSRAAIIHSQT